LVRTNIGNFTLKLGQAAGTSVDVQDTAIRFWPQFFGGTVLSAEEVLALPNIETTC
jgi:hypothetical protein